MNNTVNLNNATLDSLLGSEYYSRDLERRQDRRMPTGIVIDTSGSMRDYEETLRSCLRDMYAQFMNERSCMEHMELDVLTYSDRIHILQPLCELSKQNPDAQDFSQSIHCGGMTYSGFALKTQLNMLEARLALYKKSRIRAYSPVLFFISDGYPEAVDPVIREQNREALEWSLKEIRRLVAENHLIVFSVEVDDCCDHALMQAVTGLDDDRHVIRLSGNVQFANVFKMTSRFLIRYSQAKNGEMLTPNDKSFQALL